MEHKEISGILFAVVWAKTEKAPKRNIYQKHNKELRIRCLDPCFMHQRWLMYGDITITIIQVSQHDNYRLNHMAVSAYEQHLAICACFLKLANQTWTGCFWVKWN